MGVGINNETGARHHSPIQSHGNKEHPRQTAQRTPPRSSAWKRRVISEPSSGRQAKTNPRPSTIASSESHSPSSEEGGASGSPSPGLARATRTAPMNERAYQDGEKEQREQKRALAGTVAIQQQLIRIIPDGATRVTGTSALSGRSTCHPTGRRQAQTRQRSFPAHNIKIFGGVKGPRRNCGPEIQTGREVNE